MYDDEGESVGVDVLSSSVDDYATLLLFVPSLFPSSLPLPSAEKLKA